MQRSPLIAFAGGTVVIAVMVLSAFANLASAAEPTCPRSQTKATSEQVDPKANTSKANTSRSNTTKTGSTKTSEA